MTINIDWENLGFEYMNLPYRFIAHFKDGQWDEGSLTEDATLHLSESSPALHYGQQAFEGLKAYRTKSGEIQLFRPDQNAERLQRTARRLLMPQVPTELFINAAKAVSKIASLCRFDAIYLYIHHPPNTSTARAAATFSPGTTIAI